MSEMKTIAIGIVTRIDMAVIILPSVADPVRKDPAHPVILFDPSLLSFLSQVKKHVGHNNGPCDEISTVTKIRVFEYSVLYGG